MFVDLRLKKVIKCKTPANVCCTSSFCSCDLDLGPMTLTYERDLDILKPYLCTKYELCKSRLSKVITNKTDTQTHADRCDRMH